MPNSFATLSYLIIPLVGAGISFALIPLVLRKDYRSTANRVFVLLLLSIGLWALFSFAMRSSSDVDHALYWHKILFPFGTALFMFYYHFTCAYTDSKNRKLIIAAYTLLAAVFVLSLTGQLTSHITVESYGYAPHFHPAIYGISIVGSLFLILGLVNFIKAFRSATRYEERTRLAYMIAAIVVLLIFALSDFVPDLPPIGIFGNILFGLITAIAILKYHLLDIDVVLRKGLAYILMSTIVAVPYVGIIILFNEVFGANNLSVWGYPVLLMLLALVLQPLWQIVQRVVDRIFYRERYDFLKQLEYFSQEAHDISNLERLASSLVKLISRALQTSNVHVLLLSAESGDFTVVSSTNGSSSQFTLKSHNPLLQWLQSNKGLVQQHELDIVPELQSLTVKEREEINNIGAELFIPLKTNKDELVGLLVLGRKLSHQPYSQEDQRLILTVSSRVAIELENARLYARETMMRQELERQDEQKTEFLHSVAHELKTPLTAIISSSELISAEEVSATPSQRKRLIDNINRSAWIMDKRVAELLDLAKVQLGTLNIKSEPLRISGLIDEAVVQLSSLFKNKGQSLEVKVQESLPPAKADKERIEQVVLNLMSNANKFSPTGGKITLRAREAQDKILVEVEDSAPVISDEEKSKLFDPYYRGGNEDERERVPGLGLGLAICKKLVEQHQGKIWIENESGKGNTFIFSLPIWNGEQPESDDSSYFQAIGGKHETTNY